MALSDAAVRGAKPTDKPRKLADEKGLYLLVNPTGSKLWRFKYRYQGFERKLAFGGYAKPRQWRIGMPRQFMTRR